MGQSTHPVTIVIPIYADWRSIKQCVRSVIRHTDPKHKVLIINDNGPDADTIERTLMKSISHADNIRYYRNNKNLGFVKTCNKAAYELDNADNDMLLLNSDTKVTAGYLDDLQAVLDDNPAIAAVSPRSNNATIATIPLSAIKKRRSISKRASYRAFKKLSPSLPQYNIAPVAHGFCMLIRRSIINDIGLFDEVFGRGYGEEVDFCMRASQHGYLCAISNKSFVFHLGARSFKSDTKKELVNKHSVIITERYPDFDEVVRDYYIKNSLLESRLGK